VKEKRPSTKRPTLAISSVVLVALVLIGWIVISHWGTTVSVRASSDGRSIALQSPGVVLRQGGAGKEMRPMVANCAKGFVRRGSACEVEARQMALSAASKLGERNSVRPPERE
jgi:hypothetical protein